VIRDREGQTLKHGAWQLRARSRIGRRLKALVMTKGQRIFLFVLAVLGAVTVRELLLPFMYPYLAHALGATVMVVALGILADAPRPRPWYVVAPVAFTIMLLPVWAAAIVLSVAAIRTPMRQYRRS
jgi:hypothetical protein